MFGPQLDLMPGETMVLHAHPHWWFFWKQVVGSGGLIAVMVLAVWADGTLATLLWWLVLAGFVFWLLNTVYQFVQWQTTRFAITDERVAYQSGFFRRRGVSIPLDRVNNVNFEQNFVARLLDNGVVTIESAGETGDSVFENVADPDRVRTLIFQQVKKNTSSQSERDASALARAIKSEQGSGGSDQQSVEERLAKLSQLRDSGAITEEEYAQKRNDILGSL
jgi:uncharacterized membrane protein YdbT with pleckstrin-like domain